MPDPNPYSARNYFAWAQETWTADDRPYRQVMA